MNHHDTFLDKVRLKERAEEDIYFGARDREILRDLHRQSEERQRALVRELSHMRCPECGARLKSVSHHAVIVEECPDGHGMWMTERERRDLARREKNSWIGRYLYRLKPVV
jgi:hypothetical protein